MIFWHRNASLNQTKILDEPKVTAGCSHIGGRIRAKMHTANAATTNKRKLVSVGMASELFSKYTEYA